MLTPILNMVQVVRHNLKQVRWYITGLVFAAWVLTFPISGAIAYVTAYLIKHLT